MIFGFTEEQIAWITLRFGVSAFMLYMLFVIGHLACLALRQKQSFNGLWKSSLDGACVKGQTCGKFWDNRPVIHSFFTFQNLFMN